MKTKISPKEQALSRNHELFAQEIGGEFKILFKGQSGTHTFGSGKTEDAAWLNCARVFYGMS